MTTLCNRRFDGGGLVQYCGSIATSYGDYACQAEGLTVNAYWNPVSEIQDVFIFNADGEDVNSYL